MSGTSLDGVDVVVARLAGSGQRMEIEVVGGSHMAYPSDLVEVILRNTTPDTSSVSEITRLHARLGQMYAAAVERAVEQTPTRVELDLIGSHGQTIHHLPVPTRFCGQAVGSTLQLGDISTIANLTRTPVVGDFRSADIALGGEGAPLVPYFDYIYFTHSARARLLLNIGGIANLTLLPADGSKQEVRAFDTGPGNMLIDGLVDRWFDEPYDRDGRRARRGSVCQDLLDALLVNDSFLHESPPKSTGREYYGGDFLDRLLSRAAAFDCAADDLVATTTAFTARSIREAYERYLAPHTPADELLVSGGGAMNPVLMEMLADEFEPIPTATTRGYDVDPEMKEALCFAVLAHEFANEVPTSLPAVTGASRETILGKLALPGLSE
jgi:anhydro-N-acetylmuramic acid kinase